MDEHTVLEHLGNLGVVLLAVLLSTSVHYLFLKHLNHGARLTLISSPRFGWAMA